MPAALQLSSAIWVETPAAGVVLMGCTDTGESAALFVRGDGVEPFFYVLLPDGAAAQQVANDFKREFATDFEYWYNRDVRTKPGVTPPPPLVAITVEKRTPADHYRTKPALVLKLVFANMTAARTARRLLQRPYVWRAPPQLLAAILGRPEAEAAAALNTKAEGWHIPTAEADVDPAAKFMVEYELDPESWLEWPSVPPPRPGDRVTTCALERHLTPRAIPRMRLERPGDAPKLVASLSVIADGTGVLREVAFVHCRQDQPSQREAVVLTMDKDAQDGEGALLARLTELMQRVDPDVFVNHGGRRADWRLLDAAWVRRGCESFQGWSRMRGDSTTVKPDTADSARVTLYCAGRIEFDTQAWMQRNQVRLGQPANVVSRWPSSTPATNVLVTTVASAAPCATSNA